MPCDAVYNFVLENSNTLDINGVCCAALGHGIKGENIEHDYFGTEKVLQDLKKFNSFDKGSVDLRMEQFVRNEENQRVCGLLF